MDFEKLLKSFLNKEKQLTAYPTKKKMKVISLMYLATKFEAGRIYTEKEVNAILLQWAEFGDFALLRRELYDYRFLNRDSNGKNYRLEEEQPTLDSFKFD